MELPPLNATIANLDISWSLIPKLKDGASNVLVGLARLAQLLCLGNLLFRENILATIDATLVTQHVPNVSVHLQIAVPDAQQANLQRHSQQQALLVAELAYPAPPEMFLPTI